MILYYWNGSDWVEGQPTHGQKYKKVFAGGGEEVGYWNDPEPKISLPISSVNVTGTGVTKPDSIWWIPNETQVTITGLVSMPDAEMMIMVEEVVNGSEVVGDFRTKASIVSGVITMQFTFPKPANYLLKASRLNEGLDRIGAEFHVNFDDIEFDVYI